MLSSPAERGRSASGARPPPVDQSPADRHLGWHSRGYLPHLDVPGLTQSVTFRLADSLPQSRHPVWRELARCASDTRRRALAESWLDRGYGSCALRRPEFAKLIQEALLRFDGARYRLVAWVVMPNHVHALAEIFPGWPLQVSVKSWKAFTARAINPQLRRRGPFWQPDYFDRYTRNECHLQREIRYIEANPVVAGLVADAGDWPWSSASRRKPGTAAGEALPTPALRSAASASEASLHSP